MKKLKPILLSFYGLSNGKHNLFFGKLAYSGISDLSFEKYNRFKTFRTILTLYSTRAMRFTDFEMVFDHGTVAGTTDSSGSFWCETFMDVRQTQLIAIILSKTKTNVFLTEGLYPNRIQQVVSDTILISDLDDTLLHSFISNKLKQLKTLLFTTVEKRKTVVSMAGLIKRFSQAGVVPLYLSNSEQNLYPLLFRFLAINGFPSGPLFLKQYVHVRQFVWNKVLGIKSLHKRNMLDKIVEFFPDKKLILMGDNTQHDFPLYLELAARRPHQVCYIIIREVIAKQGDKIKLEEARAILSQHNIRLYYDKEFPDDIHWPF